MSWWENYKADLKRYILTPEEKTFKNCLLILFFHEELWFLFWFRLGQWSRQDCNVPVLRPVLNIITRVMHRLVCLITGIDIDFSTKIGKGLYIGHSGKIVINGSASLGEYCNISTGNILGVAGRGESRGVPVIGSRVYIAPGAKLIGKITIGNDCAIGANAVVTKSFVDKSVIVGIPGKMINMDGSEDFIESYKNCHLEGG